MPVIFPDGTTAEILYPPDLDLAGTNIHPYTSAVAPAGVSRDFVIDYGRVDEVLRDWGEVELLDEYPLADIERDPRGSDLGSIPEGRAIILYCT